MSLELDISDLMQEATPIVTCTIEGILEASDIAHLTEAKSVAAPRGAEPGDLSRLRERHHSVARFIAQGMSQRLVASLCNYTESYLSVLLNNPAM